MRLTQTEQTALDVVHLLCEAGTDLHITTIEIELFNLACQREGPRMHTPQRRWATIRTIQRAMDLLMECGVVHACDTWGNSRTFYTWER